MVVGIVGTLAGFVKARLSKTQIDNTVFRLHYRWTTCFCFLACSLVAATDFIGGPIQCEGADPAIQTYCWVTSTYTINTTAKKYDFSYYSAYASNHFGIGTHNPKLHKKRFHAYYQWVPFVLFFQGCLFYLPHQIWKAIEGKQLENLLQGLNVFSIYDDSVEQKKENIVCYLRDSWGCNRKYCFGYVFCELLNLFNVVGQIFLLDFFFGGMFLNYGTKIIFLPMKDDAGRYDPMIETFPRVTKCEFFTFGDSGTLEILDYLCVLPQNLLNEKIFLIMWIWFVLLTCATCSQLIFRAAMLKFPMVRLKLLEQRGKLQNSDVLELLVRYLHLGDFFLLLSIGNNVNALMFKSILIGLQGKRTKPTPSAPSLDSSAIPYVRDFVNATHVDSAIDLRLPEKATEDDTQL